MRWGVVVAWVVAVVVQAGGVTNEPSVMPPAAFLVMLFNDSLDGCSCDPPRRTGAGVSMRVMLSVEGELH